MAPTETPNFTFNDLLDRVTKSELVISFRDGNASILKDRHGEEKSVNIDEVLFAVARASLKRTGITFFDEASRIGLSQDISSLIKKYNLPPEKG